MQNVRSCGGLKCIPRPVEAVQVRGNIRMNLAERMVSL